MNLPNSLVVGRLRFIALCAGIAIADGSTLATQFNPLTSRKLDPFAGADIVTSQTTARDPFVKDEWIPKGSYYAHMAFEANDEAFLNTDRLVVDNWGTLKTWDFFTPTRLVGKGLLKDEQVTNLGEIIVGKKPGRTSPDQRILFANLGMGCLDITVANRIYQNAKRLRIGQKLHLWKKPLWI